MAEGDVIDELGIGGADAEISADDRLALNGENVAGVNGHAAGVAFVGDFAEADFWAA